MSSMSSPDLVALNVRTVCRTSILRQLNERQNREQKPFESVISFCNNLLEKMDSIKSENILINIQKEKLFLENNELKILCNNSDNNPNNNHLNQNNGKVLEKKLFELQSELTELHRNKGQNSQIIIELKNSIESKDKERNELNHKLEETNHYLRESKSVCNALEQRIQELESNNQLVKDEYQALQMAFTCLEKKYMSLDKEHIELVTRWMSLKAKDAEKLNDENEKQLKAQNEKLRKQLEDAANEMTLKTETHFDSVQPQTDPLFICARIPNKVMFQFEAHEGEVNAIKWSPNGEVVATGGADRKIKMWSINENSSFAALKGTLTGNNAAVTSIDLDQDLLLASSNDFASRVWTLSDMKLRRTLTGHSNKVLAVKFLGVSNKVVSGSHDRTLKIWDLNRHACIRTLFAGSSCNDLVTIQSKESVVASAHFDKRIRFWDTRSDSSANDIQLQGKVTALDVSPDGYSLLSCVRDDSLKCLDLRQNQVIRTFCAEGFKVGCDWTRCKFSPDNQYIVAGSSDSSVFIWNASNGKLEQNLKDQHNSTVIACCWSPNGSLLMSTDRNKKAIVWSEF